MTSVRAKVTETGRLSLPAEFRKVVGLERGGDVVVELAGKEIRITTVDEVVARAQELTRRLLAERAGTSVDDFLTERRREAEREG
jgi:bifunctional DNA-binding transcriptional regulator/antitoxin component of YhaV-PrlF toxin-antitoxin module